MGLALTGCTTTEFIGYGYTEEDIAIEKSIQVDIEETVKLNVNNPRLNKLVTWASTDNTVASVSSNGEVKGLKEGKASIVVVYEELTAICEVEVYNSYSAPYLAIDFSTASLNIGDSITVKAETRYKGEVVENNNYTWSTSDEQVALVEDLGNRAIVSGNNAGDASIYVSTTYKGYQANTEVKVTVYASTIVFDVSNATPTKGGYEVEVFNGDTYTPNLKVYSDGILIENAPISWSVSDAKVLSKTGNTFTAIARGKADIIGSYRGLATVVITVNVK